MQIVAHGAVQAVQELVSGRMFQDAVEAPCVILGAREQQPVHLAGAQRMRADDDLARLRTGGELQLQLDVGRGGGRDAVLSFAGERVRPVLEWTRLLGVPVAVLSTGEDTASQLARLLGARARPRRG